MNMSDGLLKRARGRALESEMDVRREDGFSQSRRKAEKRAKVHDVRGSAEENGERGGAGKDEVFAAGKAKKRNHVGDEIAFGRVVRRQGGRIRNLERDASGNGCAHGWGCETEREFCAELQNDDIDVQMRATCHKSGRTSRLYGNDVKGLNG